MNKVVLLLLTTSLSLGQSSFASESAYDIKLRKEFKMPLEWFSCKMTSDCRLVPVPCMASLAVSVKYINAAQNTIEKKLGPFRGCDASMMDNSTAVCDSGQCITVLHRMSTEEINRAINAMPKPKFKMKFAGFGCMHGFGGWSEPPKNKDQELACDKENLKRFEAYLGRCNISELNGKEYDLDKDSCVTCQDYFLWKKNIEELYKLHKRSTDGQTLIFNPCDKK